MADVAFSETPAAVAPPVVPPQLVASPAEELGLLVGWASALFYWAEAGENPSVRTDWDAVHYVATSLSVGPALSARVLETEQQPAASAEAGPDLAPVVERLDAILAELRRSRGG